MKEFFSKYSYTMVKMYITQFAIGLVGGVLAMATSAAGDTMMIVTGIFAALFYLFMLYTTIWEIGSKDRISVDIGKAKNKPFKGFLITLCANLLNIIVATVYTVCWFISRGGEGVATNIASIMRIFTFFSEGMYYGLMSALTVGGQQLFVYWWSYYIIIIPAILVGGLGYFLGTKNAHFTKLMEPLYPESDREPKKKRRFFRGNDE